MEGSILAIELTLDMQSLPSNFQKRFYGFPQKLTTAVTLERPPFQLPLLITGIAGVAGYNAFLRLRDKYPGQVFGQRAVRSWPLRGPGVISCDLEDAGKIASLFEKHEFASVINCCGSCALKSCERDPAMAERVNVQGANSLLSALRRRPQVRLIHLSIDLVFSGTKGAPYLEDDPPDPVSVYGKTMVEAERLVLAARPDTCLLRISLPMGPSFNGHAGAIDWIQSRFAAGRPATLYFDEVRTPTYVDCLVDVLERVLPSDLSGCFHAGGPKRWSLFEIAQIVNRVGGYDPSLLRGCFRIEAGPIPPRAGNVTMNSDKLCNALGYQPFVRWPFHDEHFPEDHQWHWQRDGFVGAKKLVGDALYRRPQFQGNSPICEDPRDR